MTLKQQLLVDFPKNPFDGLIEESSEVTQAICKIRRFGPDSRHPDGGPTNLQNLLNEINDLELAIKFAKDYISNSY